MSDIPSHPPAPTAQGARSDIVAGLVVILASGAFGYLALGYGVGTMRQMGAGFFPLLLSGLGALLGAAVVVKGVVAPEPLALVPDLRRFLLVSAAFVVFALGIEPAGLFLTIVATTVVGALAHRDAKLHESLLLGIGLAATVWLLFVVLLGLPIPLWPGLR